MNTHKIVIRIFTLITSILLLVSCSQKKSGEGDKIETEIEVGETQEMTQADIENILIKSIVDNRLQTALIQLARTQKIEMECEVFCDVLYDSHEEIQYNMGRISVAYDVEIPKGLTPEAQLTYERLEELPPDEFEEEFLKVIINHHKENIDLLEKLMTKEGNDIMERALIEETIEEHRNHLEMALEAEDDLMA